MNILFQPLNPPMFKSWLRVFFYLYFFFFNFYSELNPLLHVLREIEDVHVTHAKPHIISQQEETSVWEGRRQGEGSVYWPLIVSL